jgi:hypothetical protein
MLVEKCERVVNIINVLEFDNFLYELWIWYKFNIKLENYG